MKMSPIPRPVVLLGAVAGLLMGSSTAAAQDAVAPADGATVGVRPAFTFAGAGPPGSATIEISRFPDIVSSGDRAGWLVDAVDSETAFFGDDPSLAANTVLWRDAAPLTSGQWYWLAQVSMYGEAPDFHTPLRRMVVPDDPPTVGGMTLDARRLRPVGRCARLRLRGRVEVSDNDPNPRIAFTAATRGASSTEVLDSTGRFDRTLCAQGTSFLVAFAVRDRVGQVTGLPSRTVSVPAGLRLVSLRSERACPPVVLASNSRGVRVAGISCRRARDVITGWMTTLGDAPTRTVRGFICASMDSEGSANDRMDVECRRGAAHIRFIHRTP